ncbi:MAG TPA: hypothetical protein VK762_31840 [Polyangiaceae bacterium]|jgi:hypothetical protein|nr:hypothetical protein [Polyangiaceae bacterium]
MTLRRPLACATLAWVMSGCVTPLDLGSNDAGVPYDASCKVGTYVGTYSCTTTASSPLGSLSGEGPIVLTLVPTGPRTLGLTPDASLSTTSSGTTATSALSGTLDCSTLKLTGTVTDVEFTSSTFSGIVSGTGVIDAVYEVEAGRPALVQGVLTPPPSFAATCTWMAHLE